MASHVVLKTTITHTHDTHSLTNTTRLALKFSFISISDEQFSTEAKPSFFLPSVFLIFLIFFSSFLRLLILCFFRRFFFGCTIKGKSFVFIYKRTLHLHMCIVKINKSFCKCVWILSSLSTAVIVVVVVVVGVSELMTSEMKQIKRRNIKRTRPKCFSHFSVIIFDYTYVYSDHMCMSVLMCTRSNLSNGILIK